MLAAPVIAGCGGDGETRELTVSAAASLTEPFDDYGRKLAPVDVRFSFGGSDELAAQIRQGVKPDVYAAANTRLPKDLFEEGLVERPTVFATNTLVIAVPAGSSLESVAELTEPGLDLVVGSPAVPIGSYTRAVLGRLSEAEERAIRTNVRSEEPDVKSIVGKLIQGAAEAGLVYESDVVASGGRLRSVALPERLQPQVAYAATVVRGGSNPAVARQFVDGLRSGDGARALEEAGFGPAPR